MLLKSSTNRYLSKIAISRPERSDRQRNPTVRRHRSSTADQCQPNTTKHAVSQLKIVRNAHNPSLETNSLSK